MNEPSPSPDASEALSSSEHDFRAELNQKLRAPLNAIIGFAELVAMRPAGSTTKDADVQHILKAARDLFDPEGRRLSGITLVEHLDVPADIPGIAAHQRIWLIAGPGRRW